MDRFQNDFSFIILNEIALEGLDGITIEALCKRLSNHPSWPLKPVDDSIKKIVWSFVVCLKNLEFYRLKNPRDPLVIFNRFDYIHNEFGSLYEPKVVPLDIYPIQPIEDGEIMGSCKEYFTRFNLGSFPRKISVEEAEKRWGRSLVLVASQEVRTKALIPDDKQCKLNLSIRYYLVLERIGRARYLGEASFGAHSLRTICPDSKNLSYIRNRLADDGLVKNQALAFSRSTSSLIANRIVISSLTTYFVKRESLIDQMVSRIIDFLKLQPNFTATYERVKTECNISFAKTFKQPLLRKFCDTNLLINYRTLHPDAPKSEYLSRTNERDKEKVLRCIRLKQDDDKEKPEIELNKKTEIEGREFKLDSTYERQILRWIEKHGDLGVTLTDISNSFKFTTIGGIERLLQKFLNLKYITKRYCDRGRSKVFSYIASYVSLNENDNYEEENILVTHEPELQILNNMKFENEDILNTTVIDNSIKVTDEPELKTLNNEKFENEDILNTTIIDNSIKVTDEPELKTFIIEKFENEDIPNTTITDNLTKNIIIKESDLEPLVTRSIKHGYCKFVYESSKQTVSFTDRFYYRQRLIFTLLSTENIISLINLKKSIIEVEKENQNFIGTLDIKTLVKIVGYLEIIEKLKSVQYQIVYDGKTVNYTFVGALSVDFTSEDVIAYMNSFMNQFNNKMKTTRANKKWNLVVYNSPEPKINIADLKLPRFMKLRSLHEYLYYIVYDHPGESLTNTCNETEAIVASYRNDIVNGEKAELPKVYYPTVGWKMFVPPLQKYPKYPPGWFFVSDIIHHMPLDLMLKIVNFNKSRVNPEKLSTYASHPVFKYLPLMCLSSDARITLSQGLKKHIQSTLNTLRYLCMIGLLQFGEKTYKDTELVYAYLNKQASLMNTVKSSPSYYRISDMDYEKRTYEFTSDHELETFWLDTWYFCTNTPLGYRAMKQINIPKRRDIIDKSKIAIDAACASRSPLEAIANDDGTIPGDNKGAAGFDSHLFSHLARNWSIKRKPSTIVFPKRKTKISLSIMHRIKKQNYNHKQTEKKKSERTRDHLYSLRYKWTSDEDQLLLFWKLGSMFVKKVQSHAFISYGLKDVMRSVLGQFYRLKSVDNYLRRVRILMRYPSIEARVNFLLGELKTDNEINDLFKFDFEKQHELHKSKKYKTMRELIISNIKQLTDLLFQRGITIDTKCATNKKKKSPLEKLKDCIEVASTSNEQLSVEHFSKIQYNCSEIIHKQDSVEEVEQMFTEDKIYTSIVLSLIHSSLTNQSADPKISLAYLQAFKQYPEEILKQAFSTVKESNLITCSQYHKASLQVLLTTSHLIQSKTYDYGPKLSTILFGSTDTGRYKNAFIAYSDIREELLERKILLLNPSFGLCSVLTSLCLMNVIDISIEFDKKFLEYMSDENLEKGSKCLKNTLKRMRSRHFDLLSTCKNDSAEFDRIITSVTKQLKNYQIICKLKQSIQNFKEEIDITFENIFGRPTFEPQLQYVDKLNSLCQKILMFCKEKEQYGATQQDIKENFGCLSPNVLVKSLNKLKKRDLLLVAGIKTPTYVHYEYVSLWLVKLPSVNWSSAELATNEDDRLTEKTDLEESEPKQPPTKKLRREPEIEKVDEKYHFFQVRPWTRMDLTVNKKSLENYLNSVISKIIARPGIYLKHLIKDYYPLLQPMQTRELVEILVDMKCVKMIHVENVQKPSFFSDPSPQSHELKFSDAIGLEDNSVVMLEPTLDCEIRFGYFSNNFRELS